MAPRSTFKGALTFGPISAAVKLYKATDEKKVSLTTAHKGCGGALKQKGYCDKCDEEGLGWAGQDRRYQLSKEKSVLLTEAELKALPLKSTREIELKGFLRPESQPDSLYFGDSYYMAPDEIGAKAFALIVTAMQRSKLWGLGTVSLRSREKMCLIRPTSEGRIVVSLLFYGDEVRDDPAYYMGESAVAGVTEQEVDLTQQLIDAMTLDEFDPNETSNAYTEALVNLVNAKLEGKEVETIEASPESSGGDLSDILSVAIAQAKGE